MAVEVLLLETGSPDNLLLETGDGLLLESSSGAGAFQAAWARNSNAGVGAMQKNVSGQKIGCQMVSASDGSAFTGSVTASVTGDAGTQATGSVGAGACAHEGNGYHTYAPAQAETNYDLIAFTFTGTGAVPATVQVYTRFDANATHLLGTAWLTPGTAGTPDVNVRLISGDATAADNAESFFDGTGYAGTNNVIPTVTTTATATNVTTVSGLAANVITAASLAADAGVEIAAAVWDRVLTGATHNITNSAGRRLRLLDATDITSGTATAGTSNSITLDGTASATAEIYDENLIVITGGTGAGQTRVIVEYSTGRVATVNRIWEVTPDATSEYSVVAGAQPDIADHGLAVGGGATTITLASTASATDDVYIGSQVYLSTSTGSGQTRLITDYVGATRVATVSPAWVVNPTSASVYKIIPVGRVIVDSGTITTATNVTTVNGLAANVITAAATASDFGTEVGTAVWATAARTLTSLSGLTLDTVTTLTNLPAITANWLTAAGTAADFTTEIQTGLATAAALATVAGYIDTEVAALVTAVDALPTNAELATALAAADDAVLAAIAALNNLSAAQVLAAGDVDGYSLEQSLKLCLAALAGKVSGAATTTVAIRAADDSKARITATVTADGDRTALTLDATG